MYYSIKGTVLLVEANLVVIEAGGVGYQIHTSYPSARMVRPGETAMLYTCLQVREDAMDLYGFATKQEKECFQLLIAISGVGPKAALAILSSVTPDQLALAVMAQDEKALTVAQGVGKKLAQRILLELKDKLSSGGTDVSSGGVSAGAVTMPVAGSAKDDAIAALVQLGYSRSDAMNALQGVDTAGKSTDELIRAALKRLF